MHSNISVYQILCNTTGKRYIGSTTVSFENRWRMHKRLLKSGRHHSIRFQNAWNKYGEDDFLFLILDVLLKEDCLKYEQMYFDSISKDNLLNIKLTANSYPDNNSKERIEKLSKISTGKRLSQETINKISESKKGKKLTEEHKEKISRAGTGRKHTDQSRAKMIEARSRRAPVSEETKQRLSESRRRRPLPSDITKKKITESLINRWSKVEDFLSAKNVVTGEVIYSNSYESLSKLLGCSKTTLWNRVNCKNLTDKLIKKSWLISLIKNIND